MLHPNSRYSHPGKFEGEPMLTLVAYDILQNDGQDECFGDSQENGFYCKIDFGSKYGVRHYASDSMGFFGEVSGDQYDAAKRSESGIWLSTGSGRIEILASHEDVQDCAIGGQDATEAVEHLAGIPSIAEQLGKYSPDLIRNELREYGAWDADELQDDAKNIVRLLWVLSCDAIERQDEEDVL